VLNEVTSSPSRPVGRFDGESGGEPPSGGDRNFPVEATGLRFRSWFIPVSCLAVEVVTKRGSRGTIVARNCLGLGDAIAS
jgi:hypothetical protein